MLDSHGPKILPWGFDWNSWKVPANLGQTSYKAEIADLAPRAALQAVRCCPLLARYRQVLPLYKAFPLPSAPAHESKAPRKDTFLHILGLISFLPQMTLDFNLNFQDHNLEWMLGNLRPFSHQKVFSLLPAATPIRQTLNMRVTSPG